ncbi:MAG: DUF3795 domain-containing protein [Leptospirales bacterium]|nr:DUF3795 domain-containing protein [Leptospirales bacterium]
MGTTKEIKEIKEDKNLIAFCGLYCGACRLYLSGKCPGCKDNVKAAWCKVRTCCKDNSFLSCADCKSIELSECKKYNNLFAKLFGLIFNSNRTACINRIKEIGYDSYAKEMTDKRVMTIKRR